MLFQCTFAHMTDFVFIMLLGRVAREVGDVFAGVHRVNGRVCSQARSPLLGRDAAPARRASAGGGRFPAWRSIRGGVGVSPSRLRAAAVDADGTWRAGGSPCRERGFCGWLCSARGLEIRAGRCRAWRLLRHDEGGHRGTPATERAALHGAPRPGVRVHGQRGAALRMAALACLGQWSRYAGGCVGPADVCMPREHAGCCCGPVQYCGPSGIEMACGRSSLAGQCVRCVACVPASGHCVDKLAMVRRRHCPLSPGGR